MRILGAKFHDRSAALHALRDVRAVGVQDVEVAPLADDDGSAGVVLGASVEDCCRDEARAVLIRDGGEIVSDLDPAQLA